MDQQETQLQGMVLTQCNRIEDLEKKIRQIELTHKKRQIELENELRNEQRRAGELQESLMKNITEQSDYSDIKAMNLHLQSKLEEYEEQLIQIKHHPNKQIRGGAIDKDIKQFGSPFQRDSNASGSNSSSQTKKYRSPFIPHQIKGFEDRSPNINCDEMEGYADIDKKDLMVALLELKRAKENTENEMIKIREGAIDAIMEKERIIYELREEIDSRGESECYREKLEELVMEKEDWQINQRKMIEGYERLLLEHAQKMESEQKLFEERLMIVEREVSERVLNRFQCNLEHQKEHEKDLMSQLKFSEERCKMVEKQRTDQDKIIVMLREQINQLVEDNQTIKEQIKHNIKIKEKITELEKEMNGNSKVFKRELDTKQETIDKLKKRADDLLKNNVGFEETNKRMQIELDENKRQIENLEQTIEEYQLKQEELSAEHQKELNQLESKIKIQFQQQKNIAEEGRSKSTRIAHTEAPSFVKSLEEQGVSFESPEKKCSFFSDQFDDEAKGTPNSSQSRCLQDITRNAGNSKNTYQSTQRSPSKIQKHQFQDKENQSKEQQNVKKGGDSLQQDKLFSEIETLKSEISKIKENSEQEKQQCEREITELQEELKNAFKQMQETRRALADSIGSNKERESGLKCEVESLKTHIYKIETHMITYKLQYEEDNSYLKEELKIAEGIAAESKVKLASISQDKDYFQQKYKNLLSLHKNKKSKDNSSRKYEFIQSNDNSSNNSNHGIPPNFIVF